MKVQRIDWIDRLKAISILFVMFGHIDFCPGEWSYFYAPFFLSSFLFASGYTFNSKANFYEFLKNKIKTLIIPMVIFGVIIIASRMILSFNTTTSITTDIKDFLFQIRGKNDELWFIACIFGSSILFYFIFKLINNVKQFSIIIILLCLGSIIYNYTIGKALPWHIQMYGSACFYMGLGALYKRYNEKLKNFIQVKWLVVSSIIYCSLSIWQYYSSENTPVSFYQFGDNVILYFIISLISMIMIVQLVQLIKDYRVLSFIGKNSFIYYAFHGKIESLILTILEKLNITIGRGDIKLLACLLIFLTIEVIILIPIVIIINKYFPFILGKSKIKIRSR